MCVTFQQWGHTHAVEKFVPLEICHNRVHACAQHLPGTVGLRQLFFYRTGYCKYAWNVPLFISVGFFPWRHLPLTGGLSLIPSYVINLVPVPGVVMYGAGRRKKHKADHSTGLVFAVAYGRRELGKQEDLLKMSKFHTQLELRVSLSYP